MDYPAGHLKNIKTGRFHPVYFRCAPRPSDSESDPTVRFRSVGHHTTGYDTIEESKAFVTSKPRLTETDIIWEWDGEEIPAIVWEFPNPNIPSNKPSK